ncbi:MULTISPECIES: acetyl-CoA C-acetyltransferase [unclassified Mesorhizobium]|uniref:acetyl-CoA C-acetyltransferase n=1 Tax=unclassified Mesorhizobium TaxID=325217 RepID=UPI001CCAF64D|nr:MULTISPECIES: acetyl-CoA C-acetyltransferase [unclassified Mesorhizobium]MBZ9734276.1 acetyl-CoA C-acetyltransferase [Mesorhizobium sp. CA9]MBZ9824557.1 acetyl-CoA C-acetyltransferase [Mesorhizobium sp. CA18]MBZ9829485.1 acetyl-CoA C-acetyltransferase [Mesorhizobium sp. CA2]MBZ9837184.1 acetyl-CoA C-acetyltransferase [Mesorhizobium sp. CA3]MBZ9877925.1 acetyl-CoA C-acetyltransferase [Mesorhizobium sp. Ca11]
MDAVYVVAAKRTPIGKLNGAFASLSAAELGGQLIQAMLADAQLAPDAVSEVIMGQVLTGGAGQNPARQAALKAGLPVSIPAMTVNKVCGAGQKSIHLAAQAIRCGDADCVIAGGQDSMTSAPHFISDMRGGIRMGDRTLKDSMITDGLWDAFHQVHMGVTAEALAQRYQITREEQDRFALRSQEKADAAIQTGRFDEEIVPISIRTRQGDLVIDRDEHPNPSTTMGVLGRLRPVFDAAGTITAGNSSGLNDGAAAVLVMSEARMKKLGLTPLARIASYASAGVEPMDMGLGPVAASRRALDKAGWHASDLDVMEVNEAFAAQAIAVNREMGWNEDIINMSGGAIALGHPLAGSGCRIVVTLLHEMIRRDARKGLASLCIGGGQGVAICLER